MNAAGVRGVRVPPGLSGQVEAGGGTKPKHTCGSREAFNRATQSCKSLSAKESMAVTYQRASLSLQSGTENLSKLGDNIH